MDGKVVIVDELPDYRAFKFARLGNFSLSTFTHKYVEREDIVEYNGKSDTISTHFRDVFKNIEVAKNNAPLPITYPFYAEASKWPNARYYDISKAYLQLARAYGGEVYVKEGKSCSYGDYTFDDELFLSHRIARGLLIQGTSQNSHVTIWENGGLRDHRFFNSLYAPHLRASIMYTLHAIMYMLKRYIVYCHTDGMIVPSLYYKRVETFFENWGIDYKIKHEGEAIIKTRGTYSIGGYATDTMKLWGSKSCDYIVESSPLWWMKALQKGKELRISSALNACMAKTPTHHT